MGDDALELAILGGEGEPLANRLARRAKGNLPSVHAHLAGLGAVDTEDQAGGFGSAGTEQPRQADDLAFADGHIQWGNRAGAAELFEFEERLARRLVPGFIRNAL